MPYDTLEKKAIPKHIAIIMDGNGRWAEKRHRPRSFGHRSGQKAVRCAVEFCLQKGIQSLTLFAFSSENWQRPKSEVTALMQLFLKALDREIDELDKQNVRVNFIGDLNAFDTPLHQRMQSATQKTGNNQALYMNVAINYGGQWDIFHAAQQLAQAAYRHDIEPGDISEATFSRYLCLSDQPPPDILIRTGGDRRISNFLLWQLAYTELYFTSTLWPDMNTECLDKAITDYAHRQRRFGKTASQALNP